MPFSGTFQSLNKNDNLVLSNVLDDISFTSGQIVEFDETVYNIQSLWLKPTNGKKLWIGYRGSGDRMRYYTSSSKWDASSFSYAGSSWDTNSTRHEDFSMSPDGAYALVSTDKGSSTPIGIVRITTTTNNEPSGSSKTTYRFAQAPFNDTSTYTNANDAICGYYDGGYKALCIADDGWAATIALGSDTTPNTIKKIDIGSLKSAANSCKGCVILYDGQKLLTCSGSNEELHEFNYGTPYDISTLTYVKSIDLKNEVSGITGLNGLSALWTDRDDPYTSGIWIVSNSNGKVVKLNVNGSKYVSG
jgi:hypothetical protein